MKKMTLLFAFLMGFGMVAVQAQKCAYSKAACASKKSAMANADQAHDASAAAILASLDENIETRTCGKTGALNYVKKSSCHYSGTVAFKDVEYSASLGRFVNISPTGKKACCSADANTGCCSSKATATAVKTSLGKKSCSYSKAHCNKSKTTQADAGTKSAKLVKTGT